MIVCLCARVAESDIESLLPAEPEEVMMKTNCAMTCGICFEAMLEVINRYDNRRSRVIIHSTTP